VEQMLKEMKETFTSDDDEDSTMSQYKDMYMDTAFEEIADEVVDQLGGNVTQQLYEQMCRNLNPTLTIPTVDETGEE
jgi:flagellar protein FlgJ